MLSSLTKNTSGRSAGFIQAKLNINQPGDSYEQEADAVADKVVGANIHTEQQPFFKPAISPVQRKCQECEKEDKMQRKETSPKTGRESWVSSQTENYIGSLNGKGKPLDNAALSFFEPRMGYDLSGVQLHTDAAASTSAREINALAYTHGNNIVFGQGQYQPNTTDGKKLLAHELTHVIQQQNNIGLKPVQRYIPPGGNTTPNPFAPPPVTNEVNEHKTETISNAPDPRWNNTFGWDSRFQVVYDGNTKRATIVSRLYCDVDDSVKTGWKNAIESRWGNGQFQLEVWESCKPNIVPIDVNIEWVTQPMLAHYVIKPVGPGDPPIPGKTVGAGGTADMTAWSTTNYSDVPHEYGHMLGNPEEYFTTNGIDYTYSGTKSGYRDRGGGIMNNPSETPSARHYNLVRDAFIKMMKAPPTMTRVVQAGSSNPPLKTC